MEQLRSQIKALDQQAAQLRQELGSLHWSVPATVASAVALLPKRQRQKVLPGVSAASEVLTPPPASSEQHLLPPGQISALQTQLMLMRAEYATAKYRSYSMRRGLKQSRDQRGYEDPSAQSSTEQAAGKSPSGSGETDAGVRAQKVHQEALKLKISTVKSRLKELKKAAVASTSQFSFLNDPSYELPGLGTAGRPCSSVAEFPSTSSTPTRNLQSPGVQDSASGGKSGERLPAAEEGGPTSASTAAAWSVQASSLYGGATTGPGGEGSVAADESRTSPLNACPSSRVLPPGPYGSRTREERTERCLGPLYAAEP